MGRWDELFDDLEGRWAEEERADELGSVPDRVRRDRGSTTILDRALAAEGHPLQVALPGGEMLHGVLADAGVGWLRLEADERAQVVRTGAVRHLAGLPRAARPGGRVADRPVGAAVRDLARDRRAVRVHLAAGRSWRGWSRPSVRTTSTWRWCRRTSPPGVAWPPGWSPSPWTGSLRSGRCEGAARDQASGSLWPKGCDATKALVSEYIRWM